MADINSTDAIPTSCKLLCVLLFCGILFQYAGRTSVSVVLVDLQMPPDNNTNTSVSKSQIQYSQFQVGAILSSVYIGLLPSSFIGGYLAYRYSAMRIFLASISASSIAHCVAPFMFGRFETAITQRVVAGLAEKSIPFCHIFTSTAVWAYVLIQVAAYIFEPNILPLYFEQSFGVKIQLVGVLAGIPILIFGALEPLFALLGNILCKFVSTTVARKAMAVTGCLCVSGCLFVAAFTSNSLVAGCFVAVGFGSSAARAAVADANPFDIAPQYASVLTGFSRVVCRVVGLTFPLLVTALTKNKSRQEWSRVLLIKASVFAATAVFYGVFGSGEEQSWAVAVSQDQNEVIEVDESQRDGSKNDKVNDEKRPLVIK
ncbi:PREDICTED: vesicular glutamate transporter 3-like [Branchiostoma belcheri]|uniref:Vesicular glutamate transporter 3-like n=1 Tax=Branchiostoma belcheri TaxID=7741 RepID=A0A6P4YJT7_BRABE|nr:PREDICTED: vesicular glutamate transporter 3-like [Branchiostoma belcheri]